MSRLVGTDDTKTIHADWWDEGEEVVLRRLTYADEQALQRDAARFGLTKDEQGQLHVTDVQLGNTNLETLYRAIKSWTFTNERGKILVPSRNNIDRLSPRCAEYILAEIREYNSGRSAEEQDSFRDRPGDGAEE